MRDLPPSNWQRNGNGRWEQGAQGKTRPGRQDPRRARLRRGPNRRMVSVRTPCRDPGSDERLQQVGPRPARLEDSSFFVDRDRRRDGVAKAALAGALHIIATKGGGTVDGYPVSVPRGKRYSGSFLWGGTESMFTKSGFHPIALLGTRKMVVRKVVPLNT